MSNQKYNSKTRVNNQQIPYTQINTNVIQNIDDVEAGFVWVYLQSKPADWDVIKAHIKNKFNFGNGKIKHIFSYLEKHKLIKNIVIRTEDGRRISHHDIEVLNGEEFIKNPIDNELSTEQLSTGSEINPLDNQPASFQPTTYKRNTYKEKKKKQSDFFFEKQKHQTSSTVRAYVPPEETEKAKSETVLEAYASMPRNLQPKRVRSLLGEAFANGSVGLYCRNNN